MTTNGGYGDVEGDDVARRISEHDIEAVLGGGVPSDPSLDGLATLIRSLDVTETIPESVASMQVAAASSAALAAGRATRGLLPAPGRRRLWFRGALSGLTAKILLGTAAALAATGGAAATGILPDAVQNALAEGASHIGIELPHSDEPETTTAAVTTVTVTTTQPVPTTMAASSTTTTSLVSDGWTALAGSYTWEATACAGSRIAVEYSVSDAGHLALGPIAGGTAVVETAADRIEVRFADGVRIRITARNDGDGPRIDRDERRDCDGVDDGGTDGDGDGDSDDDDDSEGSGEGDDTADGVDDEAEPPGSGASGSDDADDAADGGSEASVSADEPEDEGSGGDED